MANLILVGGGQRSGKSRFGLEVAERLGQQRVFLATAQAFDLEMERRILRHRAERADRFVTIECPIDLPAAVTAHGDVNVLLIDCLSLWLSNLLGVGHSNDSILDQVDALIGTIGSVRAQVIVVANEVGMGLVSLSELGRRFQDLSGWAHQRFAAAAAEIYFAALGCILRLKPAPLELVSRSA